MKKLKITIFGLILFMLLVCTLRWTEGRYYVYGQVQTIKKFNKNDIALQFKSCSEEIFYKFEERERVIVEDFQGIGLYNNEQDVKKIIEGEDLYLAGISGEDEQGFIVWLKDEVVNNIELQFYSAKDFAKDFSIDILTNGEWITIANIKGFVPMYGSRFYSLNLMEGGTIEGVKFIATAFEGQQRLLLSGVELNAEPCKYPSTEDVLHEVYSKYGNIELSDHQKCLLIMDWINKNIEVGITDTDPYVTLKDRKGACGNNSSLMAALVRGVGFDTRFVNLYNYPAYGLGHSVLEIQWGGKWHLYDPSYCAYYVSNPNEISNRVDPQVASFDELRKNPEIANKGAVVMNIENTIMATLEDEEGKRNKGGYYTSTDVYKYADPAGIVASDYPLNFPATFNFEKESQICLGIEDNSPFELSSDPNSGIPMMMHFIGSAYCNVNHEYRLEKLKKNGNYILEIGVVENMLDDFQLFVEGEEVEILTEKKINVKKEDKKISICFKALNIDGKIVLSHPYISGAEYFLIDYIKIVQTNN